MEDYVLAVRSTALWKDFRKFKRAKREDRATTKIDTRPFTLIVSRTYKADPEVNKMAGMAVTVTAADRGGQILPGKNGPNSARSVHRRTPPLLHGLCAELGDALGKALIALSLPTIDG